LIKAPTGRIVIADKNMHSTATAINTVGYVGGYGAAMHAKHITRLKANPLAL